MKLIQVLMFVNLPLCVYGSSLEQAQTLLDFLKGNTSTGIRPRLNQSETLEIYIETRLFGIVDYDVSRERLTLALSFLIIWNDELKKWNTTDYGDISEMWMSTSQLWIPDLRIYTSLSDSKDQLLSKDESDGQEVLVLNNGRVQHVTHRIFDLLCEPNITYYPFDKHECTFQIAANRPETQVRLIVNRALVKDVSHTNTRWKYVSSSAHVIQTKGAYNVVEYNLIISRYPLFLSLNLIIPVAVLTLANPLVFILPQSSGERVSYSITVLLAFVVFVSAVSDKLPEVNHPFCIFNVFLIVQLIYSTLIMSFVVILSRSAKEDIICSPKNRNTLSKDIQKSNECRDKKEEALVNGRTTSNKVCLAIFFLFAVVQIIVYAFVVIEQNY